MADLGALAKGPAPGVYDDTFKLARTVNLLAAVAAGVTAYDTVYPDIKNVEGLRAEAQDARRMGYGGKIAIHPDQVAVIHEVFTPSAQEVDWAKRVIANSLFIWTEESALGGTSASTPSTASMIRRLPSMPPPSSRASIWLTL